MSIGDVITQFISTFFGVALGFGLTLLYDREVKQKQENEDRIRTLETIRAELENNLKHLKEEKQRTIFSKITLDSATSSGNFALLDVKTQNNLAEIYRDMRRMEVCQQTLLSMPSTSSSDTIIARQEFLSRALIANQDYLLGTLPERIDGLGDQIKSLKTTLNTALYCILD